MACKLLNVKKSTEFILPEKVSPAFVNFDLGRSEQVK